MDEWGLTGGVGLNCGWVGLMVWVSGDSSAGSSTCPVSWFPLSLFNLSHPSSPSHIVVLVNHHSINKALSTMGNLFKNLKYQIFVHVAAENTVRAVGVTKLMEEYLDASNYGVSGNR